MTVNLKEILCHTKGQNPTLLHQEEKIKRSINISGIDWYFRLIPNEKCYSLIDSLGNNKFSNKFIVCANLPNKKETEKIQHIFTAFDSVLDFLNYIKKIPQEKWHFFEVIPGDTPQKLYFDIDIKRETLKESNETQMEMFANNLLNSLISQIVTTFLSIGYHLDVAKEILLFSSNSSSKRSYHIIIDGYAVSNCKVNSILVRQIKERLPQHFRDFIDESVYTPSRQFRLYGSQKIGSGRPKIFVNKWYLGDRLIEHYSNQDEINNKISKEELSLKQISEFTTLFQASCVTKTDNCKIILLPSEEDAVQPRLHYNIETNNDNINIDNKNVDIILKRVNQQIFIIYEYAGVYENSLILLQRKKKGIETPCILCRDKTHANDNAFLTIRSSGKVHFHCRRNNITTKIVGDIYDLLPSKKELENAHLLSVINKIMSTTLPSIQTPFHQLRSLSTQKI